MISSKIQLIAMVILASMSGVVLMLFGMNAYSVKNSSDVVQTSTQVLVAKYQDKAYRRNTGSFYINQNKFEVDEISRLEKSLDAKLLTKDEYENVKDNPDSYSQYNNVKLGYITFNYLNSENGDANSISGVRVHCVVNKNLGPNAKGHISYLSRYVVSPRSDDSRRDNDIANFQDTLIN